MINHCPYCKVLSSPRNPHTPLHFCPTCGAQTEPVSDELPFDDVKNEKTMTWQTILKAVHTLHDGKTRAVTAEEIEKIRPLYEKVKSEVRGQPGDNPANIAAQVNHILKGRRT